MDKYLEKFLNDQVANKLVTRYLPTRSDYLKEEAVQTILLEVLESDYLTAKDPFRYMMGVAIRQINSKNSHFYMTYLRPAKYFCDMGEDVSLYYNIKDNDL